MEATSTAVKSTDANAERFVAVRVQPRTAALVCLQGKMVEAEFDRHTSPSSREISRLFYCGGVINMSMDNVYSKIGLMRTLPAGEFKQTCLRVLDEVRDTGEVVVITKRGEPVAQLVPVPRSEESDWAGAMRGTGSILGDLVDPALTPEEWEAERG